MHTRKCEKGNSPDLRLSKASAIITHYSESISSVYPSIHLLLVLSPSEKPKYVQSKGNLYETMEIQMRIEQILDPTTYTRILAIACMHALNLREQRRHSTLTE